MTNRPGRIFVCYRREDSAGHAGRLFDRLNQRFPGRVFMDVASIGLGTRWAQVIEDTLGNCQVAVIMIGKRWLDPQSDGTRRIDEPGDPIRAEVSTALRKNLMLVPLLVSGATVPDKDELPQDIAGITEWQALRLDDEDFDHGMARLIRALAAQVGESAAAEPDVEPHATPPMPPPREEKLKRSGFFGLSLGSFRVWITVGVAAMALIVVQFGGRFGEGPQGSASLPSTGTAAGGQTGGAAVGGGGGGPVAAARGTGAGGARSGTPAPVTMPANPAPPIANPPSAIAAAPSLGGEYDLRSFADPTGQVPLQGVMRVVQTGPGKYMYETQVVNTRLSVRLFYQGTIERSGDSFVIITNATNDPAAPVNTPIRSSAQFSGSLVTMVSELRQRAVWQKR